MDSQEEFLQRLRAMFQIEAEEHLQAMTAGLLALEESGPADTLRATVEKTYRETHSLKGASRAVGLEDTGRLCQALESFFARMKKEPPQPLPPKTLDVLLKTVDDLRMLVAGRALLVGQLEARCEILQALAATGELPAVCPVSDGPAAAPEAPAPDAGRKAAPPHAQHVVRIDSERLDALLRQAEEMLAAKLTAMHRVLEIKESADAVASGARAWHRLESRVRQWRRQSANRAAQPETRALADLLDSRELDWKSLNRRFQELQRRAAADARNLGRMIDRLMEGMKQVLMLPFSSLAQSFPHMVRDMARAQGKEIRLVIEGGSLEIDKRILEELRAPLVHLLRNSADHGVEKPEIRARAGKPPGGTVRISVTQADSGRVNIVVADDGAGLDLEAIRAKAIHEGFLEPDQATQTSAESLSDLIYTSGFSTSPILTDLSGRGLGLAIVKEKVEDLGGRVTVESQAGTGTAFKLSLPLLRATFRAALVEAGGQAFAIPSTQVEKVMRLDETAVRMVENRATIAFAGGTIALVPLAGLLGLEDPELKPSARIVVAVLRMGAIRLAVSVTRVLREQEILLKNLGRQLPRVRHVAGVGLPGSGELVPVLNVADLVRTAAHSTAAPMRRSEEPDRPAILVVEDSITSRTLLKNILQSAGYQVQTAVDGVDALAALRDKPFAVVVSDIEMPRMNGFDLTAQIRADPRIGELPVILVTSLETSEHRERGIDVGANAYLVKSSFDQSNLLETVRRFL